MVEATHQKLVPNVRRCTMATTALVRAPKEPLRAAFALVPVAEGERTSPLGEPNPGLRQQLRRLRGFRKRADAELLPIEQPAVLPAIDAHLKVLERASEGYRPFPLDRLQEVLAWRNTDGWPTIAPFSIESPRLELAIHPSGNWDRGEVRRVIHPALPPPLRECYEDVFEKLRRRADNWKSIHLAVAFTGVLPPDVRATVIAAQRHFKQILMLAEVDHWQIEEREVPAIRTDPLVVGFDGQDFWLIAAFDLTPIEEAIRQIALGNGSKG